MLLIVAALVVWIPAVVGWGALWVPVRQRMGGGGAEHYDVLEPVVGLACLAALAISINLFLPLTPNIGIVVLSAGWVLAVVRLRRLPRALFTRASVVMGIACVLIAALLANYEPINYDTGLYHLQTIAWFRQSATPLGLANLHGRLAFNSSWHALAAMLELPFWTARTGISAHIASPLLASIFGLTVCSAILRLRAGHATKATLFMALSGLTLANSVWLENTSSPSPDLPILVLTLLATYMGLQTLGRHISVNYGLSAMILTAAWAVTVKFSALPLLLLPAAVAVWAQRQRHPLDWRKLAALAAAIGVLLAVPWLIRSVLLSGCLAYPVSPTCVSGLPWSLRTGQANGEVAWILSWARLPGTSPRVVLASMDWLTPWFADFRTAPEHSLAAWLTIIGLALQGLLRARHAATTGAVHAGWLAAPLMAGLLFWFLTAPDVRFGAGYIWAVVIFSLAFGLHAAYRAIQGNGPGVALAARIARHIPLVILLTLVYLTWNINTFAMTHQGTSSFRQRMLEWPAVPYAPTEMYETPSEHAIIVPTYGDQCWLAPLPCTPFDRADLRPTISASGRWAFVNAPAADLRP